VVTTLILERTDLREALKYLKRFVYRKRSSEICLAYQDGALIFQLGAVSAKAQAEGSWPGSAFCSTLVVLALLEGLPDDAQVRFSVDGDRLRVAGLSFPCRWVLDDRPPVTLPLGYTLTTLLALREEYPEAELSRSGLLPLVREAEAKRNYAVARAATALKGLEITKADVFAFVDEHLRRRREAPH